MAAEFRAQRNGEGETALGMGRNRGTSSASSPLVHNAWTFSSGALGRVRGSISRSTLPFTMKGGYVGTGSERRLVIVGKIGKF
ncbi:MAG: hypothetical protein FWE57_11900 [Chitinispirillia bacterium]|nr:hypothetical protein [Chitinispirillia bacterium]